MHGCSELTRHDATACCKRIALRKGLLNTGRRSFYHSLTWLLTLRLNSQPWQMEDRATLQSYDRSSVAQCLCRSIQNAVHTRSQSDAFPMLIFFFFGLFDLLCWCVFLFFFLSKVRWYLHPPCSFMAIVVNGLSSDLAHIDNSLCIGCLAWHIDSLMNVWSNGKTRLERNTAETS